MLQAFLDLCARLDAEALPDQQGRAVNRKRPPRTEPPGGLMYLSPSTYCIVSRRRASSSRSVFRSCSLSRSR